MSETKGLTVDEVLNFIDNMKVLELSEFVKKIEERYGVSAAVPMGATAAPSAGAPVVAEEKTAFDVILTGAGDKKIQVIKVVRELTNLGLKEAKDLVDGAPKPLKTGVSKEEAENVKAKITEVGGQIEIK
ncbi:MAG TPA: 50S ribosomal protein L7/L12 [Nitrospiraceae bacterium]|nr:50S ribosomal protein L7/L12 [Nitrospiraceae bacterium]